MDANERRRVPLDGLAVGTAWLAVLILLLNDHYLKFVDPSWLTGKLSDITELFVLPMVVSAVVVALAGMPSVRRWVPMFVYAATCVSFIVIKVDRGAADTFRASLVPLTGGGTASVADATDLIALPALILSYAVYRRAAARASTRRSTFAAYPLIALTIFASVANTPGVPPNVQLLADPTVSGRIYALFVDEDYYGGTYPRGIYRTDDAGRAWWRVGAGGQRFAIDRANPGGLFVLNGGSVSAVGTGSVTTYTIPPVSGRQELYGARRLFVVAPWPSQDMFWASSDSLMRSRDRGASWEAVRLGQSFQDVAPAAVEGLLYAVADRRTLRSTDHGTSWEDVGGSPVTGQVRLGVDPHDATRLIAATDKGMYLSVDGGRTWTLRWNQKTPAGRDARGSVVFDPDHPERVYATLGTDVGLLVSGDGGATWRESELPALSVAVARERGPARIFIQADYRGVFHESRPWPDLEPWTKANAGLPFR